MKNQIKLYSLQHSKINDANAKKARSAERASVKLRLQLFLSLLIEKLQGRRQRLFVAIRDGASLHELVRRKQCARTPPQESK